MPSEIIEHDHGISIATPASEATASELLFNKYDNSLDFLRCIYQKMLATMGDAILSPTCAFHPIPTPTTRSERYNKRLSNQLTFL